MRVIATQKGFIGGELRFPGDEFEIKDSAFSEKWMKKVDGRGRKGKKSAPAEDSEIKAFNIPTVDAVSEGIEDSIFLGH